MYPLSGLPWRCFLISERESTAGSFAGMSVSGLTGSVNASFRFLTAENYLSKCVYTTLFHCLALRYFVVSAPTCVGWVFGLDLMIKKLMATTIKIHIHIYDDSQCSSEGPTARTSRTSSPRWSSPCTRASRKPREVSPIITHGQERRLYVLLAGEVLGCFYVCSSWPSAGQTPKNIRSGYQQRKKSIYYTSYIHTCFFVFLSPDRSEGGSIDCRQSSS